MASGPTNTREGATPPLLQRGWLILGVANAVVGRWKPGSIAATLLSYAFIGSSTVWLGFKIRAGYRRRRPYWTRASWLRYLKLAAMPLAAVVLVLFMSTETGMHLLPARSTTARTVSAIALVTLLLLGALGMWVALEWMFRGAASEQFTRTRWIRRPRSNMVAD